MTATTISPTGVGRSSRTLLADRLERLGLPAILLVAAANFLWHLGSSSYFTDEVYSVVHSRPSFGTLIAHVAHTETTPWTYFLFLHEWLIRTGSETEWVTRFPSVLGGIALVGAVFWMAGAFVGRRVALAAAALCAISPLIQSYAQETRVYVFLMLVVVVAVGATVRACRRPQGRLPLLVLGALSAALAILLHYTALSVVLPLAIWVATRGDLPWRERVGFLIVCALAQAAVTPLLLEQYHTFPNGGAIAGQINWNNALAVLGTPFGARVGTPVSVRSVIGAATAVCAVMVLALSPRAKRVASRGLLVAVGVVGIIGLFGLDLAGKHILITRYTAVTAPFLATVVVAACAALPRPGAAVLAVAAATVAIAGLIDNHMRSGFYIPARQVIAYVAPRQQPGDAIITPGTPDIDIPLFYYDTRLLRGKVYYYAFFDPNVRRQFRRHARLWIVENPASPLRADAARSLGRLLRRYHYRATRVYAYTTSLKLVVYRALPA